MRFHLDIDLDTGKEPFAVNDLHRLLATITATVRDSVERDPPGARDQDANIAATSKHPIIWFGELKVGRWWVETAPPSLVCAEAESRVRGAWASWRIHHPGEAIFNLGV